MNLQKNAKCPKKHITGQSLSGLTQPVSRFDGLTRRVCKQVRPAQLQWLQGLWPRRLLILCIHGLLLYWSIWADTQAHSYLTSSAWCAEPRDVYIKNSPSQPGQGEVMLLTITSRSNVTPTSLVFQGKTLSFQPCPSEIEHDTYGLSCHFTLVSIPMDITPGSHNLTIDLFSAGHSEKMTLPIQIVAKQYPEEHLTVEPKMVEFPPEILRRIKEEQTALVTSMNRETNHMYWTPWFVWPVPEEIKSPFGLRRFFNGQPRAPHAGIDLKGGIGDPVRATNNGRVVFLRDCYLSGNTMVIDHGYGLYSIYCHLSQTFVGLEEEVKKNQIIGEVGKTGRATGPHLHWGISLHGVRIDPQSLMRLLGETKPSAKP